MENSQEMGLHGVLRFGRLALVAAIIVLVWPRVWFTGTPQLRSDQVNNRRPQPEINATDCGLRRNHRTLVLDDGRVLIAGGVRNKWRDPPIVLYDVVSNTYETIVTKLCKEGGTLSPTKLRNGDVLITNGICEDSETSFAEVFNPETGKTRTVGPLNAGRPYSPESALLPDGRVVIYGGVNVDNRLEIIEIYDPNSQTFTLINSTIVAIPRCRAGRTISSIPSIHSVVFTCSGFLGDSGLLEALSSLYVWNTETNTLEKLDASSLISYYRAVLLKDERLLFISGQSESLMFEPANGRLTSAGRMRLRRDYDLVTVSLDDGNIIVTGGYVEGTDYLNSVEYYDVAKQSFTVLKPMCSERFMHTAVLLKSPPGIVYILGGDDKSASGPLTPSEMYVVDLDDGTRNGERYYLDAMTKLDNVPFIFEALPSQGFNLTDGETCAPAFRLTEYRVLECRPIKINWHALEISNEFRVQWRSGEAPKVLRKKPLPRYYHSSDKTDALFEFVGYYHFTSLRRRTDRDGNPALYTERHASIEYMSEFWEIDLCPNALNGMTSCAVFKHLQSLEENELDD